VPVTQCVKALLFQCDDKLAVVFVRGDRDVNPAKLHRVVEAYEIDLATPEFLAAKQSTGVVPGYCGPHGITPDYLLFDTTVKDIVNGVVGANKQDYHVRNFNLARDCPEAQVHDLVLQTGGDQCPQCGAAMETYRGIEVGNIFQLGTKYSDAMKATFLSQDNQEQPFVMGCYGIGVTRTVAAAIEQNHDTNGIVWPRALAPYDILLQPLAIDDDAIMGITDALEHELTGRGYAVLVDDRDAKPGFKFKDADLVGIPLRVTISPRTLPDGKLEVKRRCDSEAQFIASDGAAARIEELYLSCP
jgi:prolyl-tRNA synthetase